MCWYPRWICSMFSMVLVPSALSAAISKCNPRTDIRARHADRAKWLLEIVADHQGPVRVAQDDLRAHVDQFVREEQAALEHLLVDEHAAFGLGGHHQYDAQQVGSETRPWMIAHGHDATIDEGLVIL
jgi:hypothetical protein